MKLKKEKLQQQLVEVDTTQQQKTHRKLTMAKRIQSSLKIVKESSLSELASLANSDPQAICTSSEVTGVECEACGTCRSKHQVTMEEPQSCIMHSSPEQDTSPKLPPPPPAWGASAMQQSAGMGKGNDVRSKVDIPACELLQEQSPLLPTPDNQHSSQSPQKSSQPLVIKVDEPVSVVQKLVQSLSEVDRRALITQLQSGTPFSSSSATEVRKSDVSLLQCDFSKPAGTSEKDIVFGSHQPQLEIVPKSVMKLSQNIAESTSQPEKSTPQAKALHLSSSQPGEPTPRVAPFEEEGERMALSQEEQALDEEQRTLALLVERREAEEMVAELSRRRMNSLLSEEELAEVCGPHCILLLL